jgi:aryl-alcohol dehydrogenase-like predicted oxidoreductase
MTPRPLGRSGLHVSTLCLGGNVFGWTADEAASRTVLDRYVAGGGNFVDTANVYSMWASGHRGGESEEVIGRWLKKRGRRDDVIVATKVGMDMPGLGAGLKRSQIERAVDDSLRRLQTDHIDLYYAHADDAATPLEETLSAFDRLVKAGKVRTLGASNYTAARLQEALAVSAREGLARYECVQPMYNLVDHADVDETLVPLCRREDIAIAPYYALASGFLSGKYRKPEDAEGRARGVRVKQYFAHPRGQRILDALHAVAARVGAPPAAVAVAWIVAQPGLTSAIASATSVPQLEESLKAMSLALDAASLADLSAAAAP